MRGVLCRGRRRLQTLQRVSIGVVLSMTDRRHMTSLGKNASGFGMDNLADGSGARAESLKSVVQQPRGEVPLAQEVHLAVRSVLLQSVFA